MKKTLLIFALCGFIIGIANAQDANRRLKSGVWLKMGYDATPSSFLYSQNEIIYDKAADYGADFQLGTSFYIGPRIGNMLRFGLDASWLDFSFFGLNSNYATNGSAYFLNFLEVGPIISFSPHKTIAFDLYGRIVPSLSFLYYEGYIGTSTEARNYWGYSTNGLIGLSFRAKVFLIGAEYNFGGMNYISADQSSYNDWDRVKTSNIRLLLGFKF
jgi:hypothetical protein